MFCNNCKSARPENEAPCPNCGAPSSLLGQYQVGGRGTGEPVSTAWNASATSFNQQWNNQNPQFPPGAQPSFYTGQPWSQQENFQNQSMPQQSFWGAAMGVPAPGQQEQGPLSLLPVPYTGNNGNTGNTQEGNQQGQMQLVPFQQQMQLAIPEGQAETVYVPPLYTKPRPIIPRYRILSGMLSVLIVALLLCGGGVYLAQSKGLFTEVGRFIGTSLPSNTSVAASAKIPDPPVVSVVVGPASAIIPSATTTMFIDPKSLTPREQDKILQVGVPFYVTFSVKPPKLGNVLIKWYMNGQYYKDTLSDKPIDPKAGATSNGSVEMTYAIPATGIAEVYWVGQGQAPQLGLKLYFSVR
jgi:hypothetical protein